MTEKKAVFATVLIMAMFVAIMMMLYILNIKAVFFVILAALALLGLAVLAGWSIKWFSTTEDEVLEPVEIKPSKPAEDDGEVEYNYDQIRRELDRELGGDAL